MGSEDKAHAVAQFSEIMEANRRFYRAFRDRDFDAMANLWARELPVACMHPGMLAIEGRDAVLNAWRGILGHPEAPSLECSKASVHQLGDTAFVTCLEGNKGSQPSLMATNIFAREDGEWRMVAHQAGPLSVMAQRESREEREPDYSKMN